MWESHSSRISNAAHPFVRGAWCSCVENCDALPDSLVMDLKAFLAHTSFLMLHNLGRPPVWTGFLGQRPSPLSQLLGPVQPLSAPVHPCLVLTDVTLALSPRGIQVPGPGGVCERTLGPFAENLGAGGQRSQQRVIPTFLLAVCWQIKGLSVVVLFSFAVASC